MAPCLPVHAESNPMMQVVFIHQLLGKRS
jgi:hypothetical protein